MLQLGSGIKAAEVAPPPNDGIIAAMDGTELGMRKRTPDEGSTTLPVDIHDRIAAVKKRILEHKHLRLKSVKEK